MNVGILSPGLDKKAVQLIYLFKVKSRCQKQGLFLIAGGNNSVNKMIVDIIVAMSFSGRIEIGEAT